MIALLVMPFILRSYHRVKIDQFLGIPRYQYFQEVPQLQPCTFESLFLSFKCLGIDFDGVRMTKEEYVSVCSEVLSIV